MLRLGDFYQIPALCCFADTQVLAEVSCFTGLRWPPDDVAILQQTAALVFEDTFESCWVMRGCLTHMIHKELQELIKHDAFKEMLRHRLPALSAELLFMSVEKEAREAKERVGDSMMWMKYVDDGTALGHGKLSSSMTSTEGRQGQRQSK